MSFESDSELGRHILAGSHDCDAYRHLICVTLMNDQHASGRRAPRSCVADVRWPMAGP